MNTLDEITSFLREYDGPEMRIMEVCGSHTAAIARNGIPSLLSPRIRLISGPGCPVCVTVSSYIDRLTELAMEPDTVVVSFGDLLRVKGSGRSLAETKADGGNVQVVYSPAQMLSLAAADPGRRYVFAAVGFETTAPVYALLLEEAERRGIRNIRLLTSLKTMPAVMERVCLDAGASIGGFLAPGHVCAVTGYELFRGTAERFGVPFVVSGFTGEQLLASIFRLVQLRGRGTVENLYQTVVKPEGNREAQQLIRRWFRPCDAVWRGMGSIPGSGLCLRESALDRDAGSAGLVEDRAGNGCRCASVLTGRIPPTGCPLFGTACTPQEPRGACMVSQEGACFNYFISGRKGK